MGGHVVPGKGLNVRGYAEKLLRLLQCCPVFLTCVESTWEVCRGSAGIKGGGGVSPSNLPGK